jgi:NAD(P)-dependent dehydrogenase (short-subunit alcohol dehydrogenase family)
MRLSIRIPHADLKAATPALWRQMLDVNLISPFVLVDGGRGRAAPRPGGCVVNIGTHAGVRPKGSSIPTPPRRRRCIT